MERRLQRGWWIVLIFVQSLVPSPQGLADDEDDLLNQFRVIAEKLPETSDSLDAQQRQMLFDQVSNHPVTSLENLSKYDPENYIGFCFGRAMGTHLMARKMGLQADSVRKLFIIGGLRSSSGPVWRWHVTTIVKGLKGDWYAIDPILYRPMPIGEWIKTVQNTWDKKKKARLYMTGPSVVMPDVTKDDQGTTGEHIIELGFDPAKKDGFSPVKVEKSTVFEVEPEAEDHYMISVREPIQNRFKFEGLTIGDKDVSFRGYFKDLLEDLSSSRRKMGMQRAMLLSSLGCEKSFGRLSPSWGLGSPRFASHFSGGNR